MSSHPKFSPRRSRFMYDQLHREKRYPFLAGVDFSLNALLLMGLVACMALITYYIVTSPENLESLRGVLRALKIPV